MRRRELQLSSEQRAELERTRDTEPRAYLRECAAALLKIADGYSAHWVAQHGLHKRRPADTVYRWLDKYLTGGLAGLVHRPRGHRGFSPSASRGAAGGPPPAPRAIWP